MMMAKSNGNSKYGSDRANAVAATFRTDKQLAAIEAAYAGAQSDDERNEIRSAVLDNLDPASMDISRVQQLTRAVGIMGEREADQQAEQAWAQKFPVVLDAPVNERGAQIQRQISALEDKYREGIRPYNDLGTFVTEVGKLRAEQESVNEEFRAGPLAQFEAQQAEMAEFRKAARENRTKTGTLAGLLAGDGTGDEEVILAPEGASEADINELTLRMNAAAEARLAATPKVADIRAARSPQELRGVLAGIEGVSVESRGEGSRG
jgi:hypothetical protein